MALRIPAWCEKLVCRSVTTVTDVSTKAGNYARFKRTWQPGDIVQLNLELHPRFIEPNPRVDATRSSLAIAMGPLVYCFEGMDQPEAAQLSDVQN